MSVQSPLAGLVGVLIIGGVIYYSGAGRWVMQKIESAGIECYAAGNTLNPRLVGPVCQSVSVLANAITSAAQQGNGFMDGMEARLSAWWGGSADPLSQVLESASRQLTTLGSPPAQLQQLLAAGPLAAQVGTAGQQLQQAVDSFLIGQQLRQQGNINDARAWLAQSARQPQGFGVMAQLSLADLYRQGAQGVAPDPARARAYYLQASESIAILNQLNSPQSRQVLATLPASPQQLRTQITQTIQSLR